MLTGATLFAIGSVTAQVQQQRDTTNRQQDENANQQSDMARQPRMQQQSGQPSDRYNSGEMIIIQQDQIPETLRQTLQGDEQYKGWENAIIYQNTRTGEYLVSPRPHRFDSQGQPIETYDQQQNNQQGNLQGQQRDQQRTPEQDQAMSRNPSPTDPNRQIDQANQQDQNDQMQGQPTDPQQSNAYRTDRKDTEEISITGMTPVQRDDYPSALQETLKDPKYEGWEMGKLYKDPETDGYVLVIDDNSSMTGAKRYYRFDKDGKEAANQNSNNQEREQR